MKVSEILSRDEIQDLIRPSDGRGALAVLTTWAMIAGSVALVGLHPAVWTVLLALVILGGRHLALAILMHECAHYSLFRTRRLNDLVGAWLCAFPTWQHLARYRVHHIAHHQHAGTALDPDLDLVTSYPVTPGSLARKLLRDLVGLTGLKRVYGLVLMDLGYIRYTVSSRVEKLDVSGRTWTQAVAGAAGYLHGVIITNALLFGVLLAFGKPWLYLLWIGSYLTTFSVFIRIRSIAEHACTVQDADPYTNTRTTQANWLARITVAPHRVNYHLEHHLLMTVPYFKLPKMHALLAGRGGLAGAFTASGYGEVLKIAVSEKP